MRIFESELTPEKDIADVLEEVCIESYNQLTMVKRLFARDVSDDTAKLLCIDCYNLFFLGQINYT